MEVIELDRTKSMVKLRISGITVYTTKNSNLHRLVPVLRKMDVFTSRDLAREANITTKEANDALYRLHKKGAIDRTPVKISITPNVKEHVYYEKGKFHLVEAYLLQLIEDKEVKEKIFKFLYENKVASSLRLEDEGFRGFSTLENFIKLGFIGCEKATLYNGEKNILLKVYYSKSIPNPEDLIKAEVEHAREQIKKRAREGYDLEKEILEYFKDIVFKPDKIKRNVYLKLPSGRTVQIDLLIKYKPYLKDKKVGYVYGDGFVVAVSVKRHGYSNHILEIYTNAKDIFPHSLPVLVAENVAASTFEEAEKRQVVVIASAELRKLREVGGELQSQGNLKESEGREIVA